MKPIVMSQIPLLCHRYTFVNVIMMLETLVIHPRKCVAQKTWRNAYKHFTCCENCCLIHIIKVWRPELWGNLERGSNRGHKRQLYLISPIQSGSMTQPHHSVQYSSPSGGWSHGRARGTQPLICRPEWKSWMKKGCSAERTTTVVCPRQDVLTLLWTADPLKTKNCNCTVL